MSDVGSNVGIAPQSGKVMFESYESVADYDPFVHPERFLNVPWLATYYWSVPGLVGRYDIASILPGRLPVRALEFTEWDLRLIVPARNVLRLTGESLQRDTCELLRVLLKRLSRVRDRNQGTVHGGIYVWAYRSFGESLYGPNLAEVDITAWRGRSTFRAAPPSCLF